MTVLKAPPETLVDDGYEGMTAEEIYHYIGDLDNEDSELDKQDEQNQDNDQPNKDQQDQNNESPQNSPEDSSNQDMPASSGEEFDVDDELRMQSLASEPIPLTPQEQEELSVQWQQRLAGAAQNGNASREVGWLLGAHGGFYAATKTAMAHVACTLYDSQCS